MVAMPASARRTGAALFAAAVLGAAAFGAPPVLALPAALLSLLLAVVGIVVGRPRRWSARLAFGLLLGFLAVWGYARIEAQRVDRRAPALEERLSARGRERVGRALEERLAGDLALARTVAERLEEAAARRGPAVTQDPELFVALGQASPPRLATGVGLEVYDADGGLRAWWGDARGERLPPDSVRIATEGALVRRTVGFTLAHAAVPWVVGRDTFRVAVKDVWQIESPLGRDVVEEGLLFPSLERRFFVAFRVVPGAGAGEIVEGPRGPAATVVGARFLLEQWAAERRATAGRVMALLLLWPLAWSAGAAWHEARRLRPAWLAALGQAGVAAGLWFLLVGTRYAAFVLPESWFSPLAWASTGLGPAGRSPGHFMLTAAIAAGLACALAGRVQARRTRARVWVPVLAAGVLLALAAVRLTGPSLESAMRSMTPTVFYSPTLLFSPPLLMVLTGFALFAAVAVAALAILFRAGGVPAGRGWAAGVALVAGFAVALAAWILPGDAMAGSRATIVPLLAAGLAGAGWIAHAAARRSAPVVRLAVVAATLGAVLTMPLAAHARVQAAQELLVERAVRIGEASVPWLQYTMDRTREFLESEPAVALAIVERNPDAGLSLWSRSPLRELDFATALFLFDLEGEAVSRFSIADEDLTERAWAYAQAVADAPFGVSGSEGTTEARWAVVPAVGPQGRVGTAVALTTGALELRDQAPGRGFVLAELLAGGGGVSPDAPGYTLLGPEEAPAPHTLLTNVRRGEQTIRLAMPLDPLLPDARGYAVFALVAALTGFAIGTIVRLGDVRARAQWWSALRTQNPLRSFRVQLLLAFLAIALVPLGVYSVLGYRHTQGEIEAATRAASEDALAAASRMLSADPALEQGTSRALSDRLRGIGDVLQQDLILYWRGWTIASSRPEIFASRLFADRMSGQVYTELFATGRPIVFDQTAIGDRSFLVAYHALAGAGAGAGYVLATPLLLREDRVRLDLQRLGEGVFLLTALSVGFLLVLAWGLSRFMAGPLSALEQGTRQIAAGRLSFRLETPARRDEFGRLQRAFNAMAGRLDVSQRELEREKSRVQAILESVGAGVVALDGTGRVRLLNDRAESLLGQRLDDVLHKSVDELAEPDGPAARFWKIVARDFRRGRRADRELVLHMGGEERHYHLVSTSLVDGGGDERGLVVSFEDITSNVQSQRVIAWGEMARQVAHEIKNPLTPMKLSLQHLERTMDDRSDDFERVFHENLDLVLSEIERLEKIAGNFARFAVPDPTAREPFDAEEVAREVVALFEPGEEERVRYGVEVAGEPAPLLGEPEGFRRVLVNLLQNAREAVLSAGTGFVTVRLDWEREAGWAWVSVLDDGIGVRPDAVERLFEPSFSTKTRGTGLGLAITRRIVEAWEGTVAWEPRAPRGTAFHVRLRTAP